MPQRECFISTTSARARKQRHHIVRALYVTFPLIWPSHLSLYNCFLLLVWWGSRLHKDCLTGKIWMISQWMKGNLCEMTRNNLFFPPDFFSKPSKLLASLVSILLVPVSHNWFGVTNHSDKRTSQRLCVSQRWNVHHRPAKTFARFAVKLSFVAGKDILIRLQCYLLHSLRCSL